MIVKVVEIVKVTHVTRWSRNSQLLLLCSSSHLQDGAKAKLLELGGGGRAFPLTDSVLEGMVLV